MKVWTLRALQHRVSPPCDPVQISLFAANINTGQCSCRVWYVCILLIFTYCPSIICRSAQMESVNWQQEAVVEMFSFCETLRHLTSPFLLFSLYCPLSLDNFQKGRRRNVKGWPAVGRGARQWFQMNVYGKGGIFWGIFHISHSNTQTCIETRTNVTHRQPLTITQWLFSWEKEENNSFSSDAAPVSPTLHCRWEIHNTFRENTAIRQRTRTHAALNR